MKGSADSSSRKFHILQEQEAVMKLTMLKSSWADITCRLHKECHNLSKG